MDKVPSKSYMERLIKEKFNFSYLGFDNEFFDNLLKEVKRHEHKLVPIFGEKGDNMDSKRKQYIFDRNSKQNGYLRKLIDKVREELRSLYTNGWTISKVVLLKSEKGGKKQMLHRDFTEWLDEYETDLFPCSAMVALQDNTSLLIRKTSRDKKILLPKGHLFIFKGDLIHRGDSYKKTNYRLHFMLSVDKAKPPKDLVLLLKEKEDKKRKRK